MKSLCLRTVFIAGAVVLLNACQPVKPYQRVYLNDQQMQPEPTGGAAFEVRSEAYREGATGGGGGKASGGCGCN